jgi:hypothetical protein
MGKHDKPSPGQQARLDNNETWREADAKWQPPTSEQIAKDVELIDSTTFKQFDPTENNNAYNGRQPS